MVTKLTKELSYEARELVLYTENTERLHGILMAIFRGLAKKRDAGVYDERKAPAAFLPLLELCAQAYIRENGSPEDKWFQTFSPIARREAAAEFVETFDGWYGVDYRRERKEAPAASSRSRKKNRKTRRSR